MKISLLFLLFICGNILSAESDLTLPEKQLFKIFSEYCPSVKRKSHEEMMQLIEKVTNFDYEEVLPDGSTETLLWASFNYRKGELCPKERALYTLELIRRGASVSKRGRELKETHLLYPLYGSCLYGLPSVANSILQKDRATFYPLNQASKEKFLTAQEVAKQNGHSYIVDLLLENKE